MSSKDSHMGILQHLAELRTRLLYSAVAIILGAMICYNFSGVIFNLFTEPFESQFSAGILIGTGPAEAFILKIKLAFFAGFILVSPYLFYQLWLFVAPGLYQEEKKLLLPFIFFSTLLFLIGLVFAYSLVLPVAYEFFFAQYQSIGIAPNIRITEHLALVIKLLLAFAIIFEFPVLAVLLARLGLLTSKQMIQNWRYVTVACFIIGAILTPPDIFSQLLLAGPMMVLYGISIFLVKIVEKKQEENETSLSNL